jgi:hypothetical protein
MLGRFLNQFHPDFKAFPETGNPNPANPHNIPE